MRIFIGPWSPVKEAPIWRYLEVYWTCAGEFLIIIVPSILIQMRAYSLEHKQCYNIVIDNEKYIYIYFYTTSAKTFYYVHEIVS